MAKFIIKVPPKSLKDKRQILLDSALANTNKPPEPIVQANDIACAISNNSAAIRNLFILPWLLGLCLTCWWHIDDFITSWNGAEQATLSHIETRRRMFGDNYFEVTDDPLQKEWYNDVGADEKMSFREYLHARYNNYVYSHRILQTDIFLVILYSIGIPGLIFWAIRFRRRAPLIFDREQQLVYSWHFGHVWVQRYDNLTLHENNQALIFILRGIKPKTGKLGMFRFMVQPSGNPFFNKISSYQPILTFIAQFMTYGREKVLPSGPWETRRGFFFFKDKKPQDFDKQLKTLLHQLDNENVQHTAEPPESHRK